MDFESIDRHSWILVLYEQLLEDLRERRHAA
jgi:hypothetical protein